MIDEHERKEYLEKMNKPLSDQEIQDLKNAGWEFLNDNYIYIPNDEDGSMAYGISSIRKMLLYIQNREVYLKYQGNCREILKEIEQNARI